MSPATTIVVTNTNDAGSGSLRDALAMANDGDTITFAVTGTITLTSAELQITHNVTISGPGAASLAVNGNATFRVFENFASNVTISGLTITNGFVAGGAQGVDGAGILNHGGLTLSNCTVSANVATPGCCGSGGGISDDGGATLTVTDSTFSGNSASFDGGGIWAGTVTVMNSTFTGNAVGRLGGGIGLNNSGPVTVSNSVFNNNSAASGGGGIGDDIGYGGTLIVSDSTFNGNSSSDAGGAISTAAGAELTLLNSTVNGNSSNGGGGGIHIDGPATITNSTISGNSAGGGGGINNLGPTTITNSTVSDNSSTVYGGGIQNGNGGASTLVLNNSTISGNSANYAGGGIQNFNGSVEVDNSTISGNSSNGGVGGGGIENNASATITNSTISGNSAPNTNGGGIHNEVGGTLVVNNSTLSDNSAPSGGTIYNNFSTTAQLGDTVLNAGASGGTIFNNGGTVTSLGYNLASDDGGGVLTGPGDQINTDPLLGPLKDNGGPTATYAPLTGSPAIDKGKDIGATGQDQRGDVRPVRFDPSIPEPPGGDGSDIGAVELAVGVQPTSAASRKTHGSAGTFDINLPLSGNVGIECRSGGANNDYQMIVNFAQSVTFSSAAITEGTGSVASSSGSGTTQVTINVTGVTNVQRITVALFDVNDGTHSGDVGVRMGVLIGDVNGNAVVNASDVSLTKSQVGVAVGGSNFREDVNANGVINAVDVAQVKANVGTALPP